MTRGRRRLISAVAVALAVLLGLGTQALLAPPSHATSSGQSMMILLDMSTSMGEKDSTGRYKIEGAKMGIVSLLEALPATAEVGLMTYPGGGDDCGEPTALRSVLPLGAGNLAGTVGGLRHSGGNTPTALALRKAAEVMKARGGGTIVLVSDGEANCGEPPCPEAKRIVAEGGVALTVNTVGFNISAQGRSELECIADATGGTYTPVENGDQLGQELARNMRPMLELWSNFPAEVSVSAATAVVRAELRNTSAITASNVQVTLTPSGLDAFLPIPRPQMWLGNLGKDERRTVEWAIPVSQMLMGKKVSLKVRAAGANASSVQQEGIVHFVAPGEGESLVGPTSQFHGANSVLVLGDSYSAGDGAYRLR